MGRIWQMETTFTYKTKDVFDNLKINAKNLSTEFLILKLINAEFEL